MGSHSGTHYTKRIASAQLLQAQTGAFDARPNLAERSAIFMYLHSS